MSLVYLLTILIICFLLFLVNDFFSLIEVYFTICYYNSLIRGIIMECTWGISELTEQLSLLQSMIDQESDIKRKLYLKKKVI